jgi:hypothetical protein
MPKLTERFLAALSVAKDRKDRLVFDTVSPGLGVRLTAKGTRTFIVQWTDPVTKRKVREPLGFWGSLSIDQAREAAKVRLGQVAKGINPRAERLRLKAEDDRERAEAALSFGSLVDEWAQFHLAHRRKRHREEAQRAIKHTLADLLKRPAARIARADIINVLDKLVRSAMARPPPARSRMPAPHSTGLPSVRRSPTIRSSVCLSPQLPQSASGW